MDVPWRQLKDEAKCLALEIGASGREHHSLVKNAAALAAIRAQGVPPEHREWVWPILLHQQNQKLQRQSSDFATYNQLLHSDNGHADEQETQDNKQQLLQDSSSLQQAQELAMERFSHLNPFQERKIKRILVAYTKSKDVFYYCHVRARCLAVGSLDFMGYDAGVCVCFVQGMVEICVVLSTFLEEEDAFWAFRLLLEALLPKYHEESIIDFHTDCLVLQELLNNYDPVLCEHFSTMGVTIQLLCTKWFFSFFAESMPFELVCRLYDVLLVDICCLRLSSKIIFSTSMAVFLYLSATLAEVHDPSVIVEIIYEFCWTTLSDYSVAETFADLILFLHEQLEDDGIVELRRKYVDQLAHEQEQRKSLQRKMLKKKAGNSGKQQPRKGRIQSIRLLIQWRKHMATAESSEESADDDHRDGSDSSIEHKQAVPDETQHRSEEDESEEEHKTEGEEADEGELELEIVTTPSEKEVLAKVYQGINKINRRRSRSSSLRNFSLRASDGSIGSFSKRTLSSSSSLLSSGSNAVITLENGEDDFDEEKEESAESLDQDDDETVWERLKVSRNKADIIQHSMVGIPDEHRTWVWPILLHQAPMPANLPRTLDFCEGGENEMLLDREIVKSIENDISRTRNLTPDQVAPMRRVLIAFASRNRRVGYCQGMNEILAILLQYLDESESLLALVLLIEVLLPAYHVDSMIGLHTDCAVMNTLLKQNDPELHTHLTDLGLNMEILCTKWLVTCFLTSLPLFCGLKVIDMLLARTLEKQRASRVLLGVGISIFFMLRENLLEAKDAGEVLLAVNEYFAREMAKTTTEMDKFLDFCQAIIEQLQPDIVEDFRSVHKDEVMERFAAFEAKKIEMRHQLEEAKAKQKRAAMAPPSPPKSESIVHRYSISSSNASGKSSGGVKKSGLSSYISKPILGGSKTNGAVPFGDEKENRREVSYRRVDVLEANRSFSEDLLKMEEQLEDLADLFYRGKIDEKEHSCIKSQIVRKWCKGMNSPQSAMVRVRSVKAGFEKERFSEGRGSIGRISRSSLTGSTSNPGLGNSGGPSHNKKGGVSLYGRMKKVKKTEFNTLAHEEYWRPPEQSRTNICCMFASYQCGTDPALLEELTLSGAFPDLEWQRAPPKMETRKKTKVTKKKMRTTLSFPLHAPPTTIRQALFPTGPGSYPSPTMALQQPPQFGRRHHKFILSDCESWADVDTCDPHCQQQQVKNKRRETGWNTSFPAEYAKCNMHRDFEQTLAYQEQINWQQAQNEAMTAKFSSSFEQSELSQLADGRYRPEPNQATISRSNEELALLKEVTMREGLLSKLTNLVKLATQDRDFGVNRGTELLHLLLQLRDASVQVVHAIAKWHTPLRSEPIAFCHDKKNYCLKMISDLNFLAKTKSLGEILGVNAAKMKQNPFMMPAPIPERDFSTIQNLAWSKVSRMLLVDPVERVADAEKYLVWCLSHLADPVCSPSPSESSPTFSVSSNCLEKSSGTWQKRAEKQLQMLSMPLELPMGQTHIMDSSKMMKRKGYLPSLVLSPPKTLTDLMDNAHQTQPQPCNTKSNALMYLRAYWDDTEFSTSSKELEALGTLETPPHHMVTLVAASILILLSPSDRIPKDLSWTSCRKMLTSSANPRSVSSNEHFQPKFLSEFSHAAGVLCAWVFACLAMAQNQEYVATRSDEDRLDLLGELELDDDLNELPPMPQPASTPEDARPRSKSSKRVTVGNAEVLFINENQPVSSSPRPGSRGETSSAKKKSSLLIRTSPWTFHGVTYFVSFFLEQGEAAPSIKLYEPMSSVESQIFVNESDLEADFDSNALESFQARNFRQLCDLILSRLNDMMTEPKHSARQPTTARSQPSTNLLDEKDMVQENSVSEFAQQIPNDIFDLLEAQEDELQEEYGRDNDPANDVDEHGEVNESALRIQCAARQRLARDRVKQARFQKKNEIALQRAESATRIQSLARQNFAKKEVARMRLEHRIPTGIPTSGMTLPEDVGEGADGARISDTQRGIGQENISEEGEDEEAEAQEQEVLPPPEGHFQASDGGDDDSSASRERKLERPETVMSYASDQFEDDFEDE